MKSNHDKMRALTKASHTKKWTSSFTVVIQCWNRKDLSGTGKNVPLGFDRGSLAGDIFNCVYCDEQLNFVELYNEN